ncbi:hypothetical protein [Tenacibaculum caenipelagi]|uniref:Uncharacterized protein n=1 Tax=Tenacibaculum caenipelagi TaxID=1325435 RepID=A0A4R6TKE3_9FLAO|nr:hypothetical protein [Tenacibaculum caenipelagi]TDQ29957.1 hypothetical protein DFQ07_0287 [Tenacibaculum caenipelagi]
MEEIVFKTLLSDTKFSRIENFIQDVISSNKNNGATYETVRESLIKLILYRFIKIDTNASNDCILKEPNFYQARELGSVSSWLEKRRAYRSS